MNESANLLFAGPVGMLLRLAASVLFFVSLADAASAQAVREIEVSDDGSVTVVEKDVPTPSAEPEKSDDKNTGNDGNKSKDEKKDGEKSDADEKKEAGGPVKRPMTSEKEAADIKSEAKLDKEGHVSFNLRDQPWEVVLQWIADSSNLSFDWQELPGDTLNLTTTKSYPLEEARDMINRHLLARGYTMVLYGEFLSVMKLSDVKSSLVPRVTAEELKTLPRHTLCKMSFDLQWLIADEVLQEVAPLLSKAGKISKMSRTNRLEIMDTAGTLQEIQQILSEEQSDTGQEQLVKTFHLENRRAEEVIVLLRDLLGVDPPPGSGGGGGYSSSGMSQMANVMKQMTQQLQRMGNSGGKGGGGREPTKTRLVLNPRENMILAQAMPDQMAIIEKAIAQIDVPVKQTNSLLNNINRVKVYRLETFDPQTLVDMLTELGDLGPGTVLKVDDDKKSIVAFATLADHLTITTLVEKLDQSARSVEVIPLRRLEADYVAGTIRALMAPPEKQQNNSRYSYYSRYSSSSQENKEDDKKFKVEADIENNRLLVYANKVEMEEIHTLLQKLGEIPDPNARDRGLRVFELSPGENPQDVIDRLRGLWNRGNKIEFQAPPKSEKEESKAKELPDTTTESPKRKSAPRVSVWPPKQPTRTEGLVTRTEADQFFDDVAAGKETHVKESWPEARPVLTTMPQEAEETQNSSKDNGLPPVKFSISSDGSLIVSCDDKEALMQIEDLMKEVAKPAPKYRVYTLKYATPSWITLNLKEYFEAEQETETSMNYSYFYGYYPSTQKKSGTPSLGKRRIPTFIYDNFTSTILVRGADRRQLQIIDELIELYDVPEPADTRAMRVTKIFRLENSKAEVVAQAVKDVFRDLLSSNDKALEKPGENKTQTRVYSYFGSDDGGDDDSPIRFKGLLSIGVDPNSDTLVVSSTASLMDTITELVLELDKAGERSSSLQLIKVDPSVDLSIIQDRLNEALGNTNRGNEKQNKNGAKTGQGVPVGVQPQRGDR